MTIITICLVLLAVAGLPFWGPIVLLGLILLGKVLLTIVCYPFDLIDRWKRRRGQARRRLR
jgi:hypothetical protein